MTEIRLVLFGSPEHAATLALRSLVMREPDHPPFSVEEIDLEADDAHFALFDSELMRACLLMTPLAERLVQMRQVAVHPEFRRRGHGRRLVEAAEVYAQEQAFQAIVFYARPEAVTFYQRLGYVEDAPWFTEVGVPEQMMAKRI